MRQGGLLVLTIWSVVAHVNMGTWMQQCHDGQDAALLLSSEGVVHICRVSEVGAELINLDDVAARHMLVTAEAVSQ